MQLDAVPLPNVVTLFVNRGKLQGLADKVLREGSEPWQGTLPFR